MKKYLIAIGLVVLLLAVGLSGCVEITNINENTKEVEVTIVSTEYIDYFIYSGKTMVKEPVSGYTYFVVELKVENIGSEEIHSNITYVSISDTTGVTWEHSSDTYDMAGYFDSVDLQPNNFYQGKIVFEVIENSTINNFYYSDNYNDIAIPIS